MDVVLDVLFNSFSFLFCFAFLALGYYALPHARRWPLLLVASLGFYATFQSSYLILLLGITAVTYVGGLALSASQIYLQKKIIYSVSTVVVLGSLVVFKYYDFFVGVLSATLTSAGIVDAAPVFPRLGIVVAVGLSFYTFSCLSYLADVLADRLPAERHFGHFALYVSFFPKLLTGPIERARPFLSQLRNPVVFDAVGVTLGLQLILWGLFKKVVIADRLAAFVDKAYAFPAFTSPADLVLATYFFAFQLYCDFSGYSDMAIGAAKVLGIDLAQNFRRPYLSTSVSEFWARRWHLSLASWFRDYMYIPLGGSHVSRIRHYANVLGVFLVSGLWHGANWTFVVWGGLNGLYQVVSLVTRPLRQRLAYLVAVPPAVSGFLQRFLTFHLILVTWVFFRSTSLSDATTVLSRVVTSFSDLPHLLQVRIVDLDILLSLVIVGVLLGVEALEERRSIWDRLMVRPTYVRWTVYYVILLMLVVLGTWDLNQFVYMQF